MRFRNAIGSQSLVIAGVLTSFLSVQVEGQVSVDPFERTLFLSIGIEPRKDGLRVRYSSRSTFRGLFGFGWCSPLDGQVVTRVEKGREQILYYGCDQKNGGTLDPRVAGKSVQRRGFEFVRRDENGREVEFDSAGRVAKLGDHSFEWSDHQVVHRSSRGPALIVQLREWYGGLRLVSQWDQRRFEYSEDGLLLSDAVRRFTYNRFRNIVRSRVLEDRRTGVRAEEYAYEDSQDRLRTVTRLTSEGVERLWLEVRGGDGGNDQNWNEIVMELRRGAEMRPVRVLYDRLRRGLRVDGGSEAVALILGWLRGVQND